MPPVLRLPAVARVPGALLRPDRYADRWSRSSRRRTVPSAVPSCLARVVLLSPRARIARYRAILAAVKAGSVTSGRPRPGEGRGMSRRSLMYPPRAAMRQSSASAQRCALCRPFSQSLGNVREGYQDGAPILRIQSDGVRQPYRLCHRVYSFSTVRYPRATSRVVEAWLKGGLGLSSCDGPSS